MSRSAVREMLKITGQIALVASLLGSCFALAQAPPVPNDESPSGAAVTPVTVRPITQPCAKPAVTFDMDDYNGPFSKLVGSFSQKVEIKTVHQPGRHHQGALPCSLNASDKFHLFVQNTFEPISFIGASWDAGWAHVDRDDPSFGSGATGYSKRYAAALADNVADDFFSTFLYPSIFHQDPRYYRLGRGTVHQRLGHALRHVFVAHSDSGSLMFNYSEWLGTASSKTFSNLYHPGNERGVGSIASRGGVSIATDMGWDVFREFWPEIAHKFHLPFKNREYAQNHPVLRDSRMPATSSSDAEKPVLVPASPAVVLQ
jgi:hypothetical protein